MNLTLHVVPVGTSLIRHLVTEQRPPLIVHALEPSTFPMNSNPGRKVRIQLLACRGPGRALDLDALLPSDPSAAPDVRRALARMSYEDCAEWNALDKYRAKFRGSRFEDEAYLFVATDTDQGLRAAALVAARIALDKQADVDYIDDPRADRPNALDPGRIYLARVPGLDLSATATGDTVVSGISLGEIGGLIAHTATQTVLGHWSVVFHLTSGYKAMLPYFLVVAEAVQTLMYKTFNTPARVSAWALHEDSEQPLALPVRWLTRRLLDQAKNLAPDGGVVVDSTKVEDLRGMYVDHEPGQSTSRLNMAGMILGRTLHGQ